MHWFLPTTGDSRSSLLTGSATYNLADAVGGNERPASLEYLTQIARAAEQMQFDAVLIPTGSWCLDAWTVATAVATQTSRIDMLVALRPGLISPTVQAQQIRSFQELIGDRLRLNVVAGGEDAEQRRFGDRVDHDQRYARANEYVSVLRGLATGEHVDFLGNHFTIEDAFLPTATTMPPVYLGGSSDAAIEMAAEQADVFLTWGEPVAQAAAKRERVVAAAQQRGRELEYGIRLHVITRPTSEAAWQAADDLVASIPQEQIDAATKEFAGSGSVGQQRMAALRPKGRDRESLTIEPNLWGGIGLVRGGAGTALVGSHVEVADAIERYINAGYSQFIFSGTPHLEETYWFGEGVTPILQQRGLLG
ncbi:LLM class flavin-dependent oxidoreductase [Gulosibacter molinativorax]|nr:LLM class flavin-dependent oxidoreductase [Gulosibacter molinativorax]QUY62779.1 Alkanesulfonate monooxygenase [Gulosibacter molinativorax]